MAQMNLSTKQKETHTQREQTVVAKVEEVRERGGLGVGVSRCQLLYLKWINNKVLLYIINQFSCSVVSDSATPWTVACQASLSTSNSRSLLKLKSIESVMPSNHLILCRPLLLLLSIFLSQGQGLFQSVSSQGWPKYWSLASASVLPMNTQD